jgi:hypothetical protein
METKYESPGDHQMNDLQPSLLIKYATLLQRISSPKHRLKLQIHCDIPNDEDARMVEKNGAPLKTLGKFISAQCGWDGRIACWIDLADLKMTNYQVGSLMGLLQPSDPHLNVLGEALVQAHQDNFLDFISTFESGAWQQGCIGKGCCQFQLRTVPERGLHLVLTLTARFLAQTLGAADKRKPAPFARHVQFGRYASLLLRLAQGRYQVRLHTSTSRNSKPATHDWAGDGKDPIERWQGDVGAAVNQSDLGVSVSFIESCLPLLQESGDLTDFLGEALLSARFNEFEAFIAEIPPDDWRFATRAHRHNHWGLNLSPAEGEVPYQLWFGCHVSRISEVLNSRLLQAAAEANL